MTTFEHVNRWVADVDASVRFYEDVLGLRIRWQGTAPSGVRVVHVGNDHFYLALAQASDGSKVRSDGSALGINHIGLMVDDLDATLARARAAGFEPYSEMAYDPGRHAYLTDPDGLEIELVEYANAQPGVSPTTERATAA